MPYNLYSQQVKVLWYKHLLLLKNDHLPLCSDFNFFCNCVLSVLIFSINVLALFSGSDNQFCLVHCPAEVSVLELWFQAVYNKGMGPAEQRTL